MFFNKKVFILFSVLLASPNGVFAGAFNIVVDGHNILPENEKQWKNVAIGTAAGAAVIGLAGFALYRKLGGTKSFKDYIKAADAQAQKALNSKMQNVQDTKSKAELQSLSQRDTSKMTTEEAASVKKYKYLTLDEIKTERANAYTKFVADETANRLGISSENFTSYLNKVQLEPGVEDTVVNRLYRVQDIVGTMTAQELKLPALQGTSKLSPFKLSLQKAIEENLYTPGAAMDAMGKLPTFDPSLGGPVGQSFGAQAGEGLGELTARGITATGDAARSLAGSVGNGLSTVGRNVADAGAAYSETLGAARASGGASFGSGSVGGVPDGGLSLGGAGSPRGIGAGGTAIKVDAVGADARLVSQAQGANALKGASIGANDLAAAARAGVTQAGGVAVETSGLGKPAGQPVYDNDGNPIEDVP